MFDYMKTFHPDVTAEDMAKTKVADILDTSIDVVEFIIELEDNLGLEPDELDMKQLAPKFGDYDFTQLAEEILIFIQNKKS